MKPLIVFLLLSALSYKSIAQNCKSLAAWNDIILQEYPELNTASLVSGSKESNHIIYNLFSDKYFVPFAGKPYYRLSKGEKRSIWRRVRDCHNKKKYQHLETKLWLHYIGLTPLFNDRIGDEVELKAKELKSIRKEYDQMVREIEHGDISFDRLNYYRSVVKNRFDVLFPSEVSLINSLMDHQQTFIANRALLIESESCLSLPDNYNSLLDITSFEYRNKDLIELTDQPTRIQSRDLLDEKINTVLTAILPGLQNQLSQIPENAPDVDEIDDFRKDFEKTMPWWQKPKPMPVFLIASGKRRPILSNVCQRISFINYIRPGRLRKQT